MKDKDLATFLKSPPTERRRVFDAAARKLGVTPRYCEKDFWVSVTLDALFNRLPKDGPRMLFKGGTSLSKSWGNLIQRFSEDIDIAISRDDLGVPCTVAEYAALGRNPRDRMEARIMKACADHLDGTVRPQLQAIMDGLPSHRGTPPIAVTMATEPEEKGQTIKLQYPTLYDDHDYVRPWVWIESGAKADHEPHAPTVVTPYIASVMPRLDLSIPGVRAIRPERTLWDKMRIMHEQRSRHDDHGELTRDGKRLSRHYYDVHRMLGTEMGQSALQNGAIRDACIAHGKAFFRDKKGGHELLAPGTFRLLPTPAMSEVLSADYDKTRTMLFGHAPTWPEIMERIAAAEAIVNAAPTLEPENDQEPEYGFGP